MSAVVHGLPELKAKFAAVEREVGKVVIRRGAGAGAKTVKQGIGPFVPVKSGTLKRSLIVKFDRAKSNDTQALYVVTFRQGKRLQKGAVFKRGSRYFKRVVSLDAFYAPFVEHGHRVRGNSGTFVEGKYFFRDGLRATSNQALQTMVTTMDGEIAKAARKTGLAP